MGDKHFPNETEEYRAARAKLLEAEQSLRAQIEQVAKQRRELPAGGALKEDYEFDERVSGTVRKTQLSELFSEGRNTLVLYNFMYGPNMKAACPLCTSLLDGLDAQHPHVTQQVDFAVVARSRLDRIHAFAEGRHWRHLRLLSSADNSYNVDYHGEDAEGRQMPMVNVFVRRDGAVHHFWGSEMLYSTSIEGGDMRHADLLWPLWNVLDLTPGGRGEWYPALDYD